MSIAKPIMFLRMGAESSNVMNRRIQETGLYDDVDPQFYDSQARAYGGEQITSTITDILRSRIPQASPLETPTRLLDIAAGTGLIARVIRKELGYFVEATDLSVRMLVYLRQQDSSIPTKKGDMNSKLPYEDGTFHAITTHWANRYIRGDAIVREAYRLLKPGGIFIWPFSPKERNEWKFQAGIQQPTRPEEYMGILQNIGFQVELQSTPVPVAFQNSNIAYPTIFLIAAKP